VEQRKPTISDKFQIFGFQISEKVKLKKNLKWYSWRWDSQVN